MKEIAVKALFVKIIEPYLSSKPRYHKLSSIVDGIFLFETPTFNDDMILLKA